MHLYPVTLEELVDENNPVRVIDAFVDHLNGLTNFLIKCLLGWPF